MKRGRLVTKAQARAEKTHIVTYFIGNMGRTKCGLFARNVTAYKQEATCKKCRRCAR